MTLPPDRSGPYADPRLTERRGDLHGPVAVVFAAIVVISFAALATVLLVLPPVVIDPTPGPSRSPGPTTTLRPTATPSPSTTSEPNPGATATVPTVSAGDAGPVVIDGEAIGSVTLRFFRVVQNVPGQALPVGSRWLTASIRYDAAGTLAYDAADWVLVDSAGRRWPSMGDVASNRPLGSGELAAGATITANVTFQVPSTRPIESLVLTDGGATDLLIIETGQPES